MENSCGIELTSSIAACASIRSIPSSAATTTAPRRPTNDTPMNERPMSLWSVVVNHSPTDDMRALGDTVAPGACVSVVVIGGGLSFRFGRADTHPILCSIGYERLDTPARLPIGRRAG